jgi:hypothetical protein
MFSRTACGDVLKFALLAMSLSYAHTLPATGAPGRLSRERRGGSEKGRGGRGGRKGAIGRAQRIPLASLLWALPFVEHATSQDPNKLAVTSTHVT